MIPEFSQCDGVELEDNYGHIIKYKQHGKDVYVSIDVSFNLNISFMLGFGHEGLFNMAVPVPPTVPTGCPVALKMVIVIIMFRAEVTSALNIISLI